MTNLFAQIPPPACDFPGCNLSPANVIVGSAVPAIATWFLNSIAALSVIFILIGGARLLLSFGNDEAYTKAQKTILWALGGLVLALTSHRIVAMIISEQYVGGGDAALGLFASAVRIMTLLLNGTFLLMLILGGLRMVIARGKDEEVTKGRKAVLYAIAGVLIINVAPFVVKAFLNL